MTDETPVLQGYEVTRDGDGWVARSTDGGFHGNTIELRGRDQAELNAARHEVYSSALSRLRGALADYDPGGFRKSYLAQQAASEPAAEPRSDP
jgi:hypothetical protein